MTDEPARHAAQDWSRRTRCWLSLRPAFAIGLCAIVAAVLSCFPVVFGGRSFVSPDNGVPLLYDRSPFLPGYQSEGIEDGAGTDVGALMWQHLSYAAIERRALLGDHQLPLWNRFNSSGTPLLGQGLSMLADPLNLAVVLSGANAWAWDVKFVLSKAIFGMGIGLLVLACVGDVTVALLMTASSVLMGFFSFRFNHPAVFSLCYSPWILYCWVRITDAHREPSGFRRWVAGLLLAQWMVLNSGTVKEAYMLLIFLNGTGLLLLLGRQTGRAAVRIGARVILAQLAFALISAPLWVTFLDALQKSYTTYDTPEAHQIAPSLFLGLFDDIFYRGATAGELKSLPSANFLVCVGCLWALARAGRLAADRTVLALSAGAVLSLSVAFRVIPADVIVRVPLIGRVVHVGNTFTVVALIHLLVLAGFGLKAAMRRTRRLWMADMMFVSLTVAVLLIAYFDASVALGKSAFFDWYVASLVAALLLLPILLRTINSRRWTPTVWTLVLLALVALHWRHGMYGKTPADAYVMNPQVRPDFTAHSAAIDYLKTLPEPPFRSVGFENVLFPGYNGLIGVESFYGCDALQNPAYRDLAQPTEGGWRSIVHRQELERMRPLYDFLNVRYYLSSRSEPNEPVQTLRLVGHYDLDVYASDSAWPRAFFTNALFTYSSTPEFLDRVMSGPGPFAAVAATELGQHPELRSLTDVRPTAVVVPASRYRLTTNTTTFSLVAPERGVVVLGETYSDGDFSATVNGRPATVLRVNHAFKGVLVDGPGVYTIRFSYWPRWFSKALVASGVGMVMLLVIWVRRSRSRLP